MKLKSLKSRLIWTSIGWVALSFTASAVLLISIFHSHIQQRFDAQLESSLEELVAASEVGPDGVLTLAWRPSEPHFIRPLSGWYWIILREDQVMQRSISLLDAPLNVIAPPVGALKAFEDVLGPEDREQRTVAQKIVFPNFAAPYTYIVAGPLSDIEKDVWRFGGMVVFTLLVLGVTLLGIIFVQVGFGLKPLRAIQQRLADVRAGRKTQMAEASPLEVQPVIQELNELLAYNTELLGRARSQVGNLAHALKTPLTILRGEAREITGQRSQIMLAQIDNIDRNVDHYLKSARISGGRTLGLRADVGDAARDLAESMRILHKAKDLVIETQAEDDLIFHGDPQDLEEMVGNLMDNACKWAKGRVRLTAKAENGKLVIVIGDDGPGIAAALRESVLARGRRLDENAPGSGLGLDITTEIAETYRGGLTLGQSDLGGLSARLTLPLAPK